MTEEEVAMAHMSPELSKLLDEASMLPLDEQEILANSLLSNLAENVDETVQAAWDEEIKRRIEEIRSGKARMIPLAEVRERIAERLRNAGS
jgi:putative addiction module component (TIGR02574 family)